MRAHRILTVVVMLLAQALPAATQENVPIRMRPGQEATVQANLALTLPLPEGKDPAQQQEEMLRAFYAMAAKQCGLVTESLATRCEVRAVNSSVQVSVEARMGPGTGRVPSIQVTGQVVMVVEFQPPVPAQTP